MASPIAVPSPSFSRLIAARTESRFAVGVTTTWAALEKAMRPTRVPAGTTSMNRVAAALAAAIRLGETSVAFMEAETSTARMIVGVFGTSVATTGLAMPKTSSASAAR